MIEYEPIYSRPDHPMEKQRKMIRRLKCWVAVLATADIIYTVFAALVIAKG